MARTATTCDRGCARRCCSWSCWRTAALRAQLTFTTIIVQDQVPLDLPPRAESICSEGNLFITRACPSAAARERLRRGLGFREQLTVEPDAPGPVILSGNELQRIPGDHRLRGEM